jgi:hypothetical protein
MRQLALALAAATLLALPACGGKAASVKPSPVGSWVVDAQRFVTDYAAAQKKMSGKDVPEAKLKQVREGVKVDLEIKADGTWTTTGTMMGSSLDEAGTWKRDGEKLTVTMTMQDGKPPEKSRTVVGSYRDDGIVIRPGEHMPFDLHMIRK